MIAFPPAEGPFGGFVPWSRSLVITLLFRSPGLFQLPSWLSNLSVTRKDVRRLKRMSCPATAPFDPRFLVRLERRFLVPA
jgi:hypothetical protein